MVIAGQVEKATEDAVYGLTSLATGYGLLFDFRAAGQSSSGDGGRRGASPQSRPPISLHVAGVIAFVESTAYYADYTVSAWLNEPFIPYRLWNQGEPNPLVTLSLTTAARRLPDAAVYGGHAVLDLALDVRLAVADVKGVIGISDPAEVLPTDCPNCHSATLVRIGRRTMCAIPNCDEKGPSS